MIEKKLKIGLKAGASSLKAIPKGFWEELVRSSGTRVLSSVSSPLCDSYLLSDSSLLVFPQKLIWNASSQVDFLKVVAVFFEAYKLTDIDYFVFEVVGKDAQKTFALEAKELARFMPAAAFRMETNGGYSLFHYTELARQKEQNASTTLSVTMDKIPSGVRDFFSQEKSVVRKFITENTTFRKLFDSFDVQDLSFQPFGYFLNAVKGDRYFTFQIPPGGPSPAAWFETNTNDISHDEIVMALRSLFKAEIFTVVTLAMSAQAKASVNLPHVAGKGLSNGMRFDVFYQAGLRETVLESLELPYFSTLAEEEPSSGLVTEALPSNFDYIASEMLAHVPAFVHPHAGRVLVVSSGTNATANEILRHKGVQECHLVLLEDRTDASSSSAGDERLNCFTGDLVSFLNSTNLQFDLILNEVSYTDEVSFATAIEKMKSVLAPGGIVVTAAGSPFAEDDLQKTILQTSSQFFTKNFFYNFSSFKFPGGLGSFIFCGDNSHPLEDFDRERFKKSDLKLNYYNQEIHFASFFLPTFMRRKLQSVKETTPAPEGVSPSPNP